MHTMEIQISGWAWGGFKGLYRATVQVPAVPTRAAVKAFAERLMTGAAGAELGTLKPGAPAERVTFGDFQSVEDCRIEVVTRQFEGNARHSRQSTERRTLRGWTDRANARAAQRAEF